MPKIIPYFNPCSSSVSPQLNERFKQLSACKKFLTVAATAFAGLASFFMGGLGGLAVFRALVNKWKPINLETTGKTPQKVNDVVVPLVTKKEDLVVALNAINSMGMKLFQNRGLTVEQKALPNNMTSVAIAPSCLVDLLAIAYYAIPEAKRADYFKSLEMSNMQAPTQAMVDTMKALIFDGKEEGKIAMARLYGTVGNEIPEYLQKNQKMYDLKILQSQSSADLADQANQWIDQATNGKITNIFSNDVIKILASAFYFKLNWTDKFNKENTKDQEFTLYNGNKVQAATMHKFYEENSKLKYYKSPDYQLLEVPYQAKGREITKLLVLPNERVDILELEKKFDPIKALKNLKSLNDEEVRLSLPKTKLTWKVENLIPVLIEMGIPCEDFKKVFDFLLMKVVAETNEEGSEVAAVAALTQLECERIPEIIEFNVNRSFMSFIIDRTNNECPVMLLAEDVIDEKPLTIK